MFREIVKLRPGARYIYVADDAYFPYGQHTEDEIVARVVPLVGDLIAEHAPDLAVIACNTASTLVMTHLREVYTVPFVGHRAGDQARLRLVEDQARVGAWHQRHREARVHEETDR